MMPLAIPGFGTSTLLLGALVFSVVLLAVIGYFVLYAWDSSTPWDDFADATGKIVESEDADAIAFIPYSDGPLIPKPAIYDRELLGGKGGYRTSDGERIYVDGQGNGTYSLQGTDVILAIDPTEHAAAADPLKAYIAHETNLGRWIKVDRKGQLIEAGSAIASVDGETPAMETAKSDGVAADGGYVSAVHERAIEDDLSLEDAKKQLEQEGLLHKIVDLAPPRETVIDEESGEIVTEEATHVAIDVSEAADLLPKKTNTTAWQTMEERARQEGRDEEKLLQYTYYGIAIGGATVGITAVVIALVLGFT
ncbi:MAG: hypothetical protein ACOCQY_02735 [Halorhabdus sp.]